VTYDELAERAAELRRRLEDDPADAEARRELDRVLDEMHPGGW